MFDEVFTSEGIEILRSPPQGPRANAYAKRWARTVLRECLDRMLIYHPRHLLAVMDGFLTHYNQHHRHAPTLRELLADDLDASMRDPGGHDAETDTIEETAYVLDLVHAGDQPIVVTARCAIPPWLAPMARPTSLDSTT